MGLLKILKEYGQRQQEKSAERVRIRKEREVEQDALLDKIYNGERVQVPSWMNEKEAEMLLASVAHHDYSEEVWQEKVAEKEEREREKQLKEQTLAEMSSLKKEVISLRKKLEEK